MAKLTYEQIVAELKNAATKYTKEFKILEREGLNSLKTDYGINIRTGVYGTVKSRQVIAAGAMGQYNDEEAKVLNKELVLNDITTYHAKNYVKQLITELTDTLDNEGIVTLEQFRASGYGKALLEDWTMANIEDVVENAWTAVREGQTDDGTAATLFNGLESLITKAIADGYLATVADKNKNNLSSFTAAIDGNNAISQLKAAWNNLPPKLKKKKLNLYIPECDMLAYQEDFAATYGESTNFDEIKLTLPGTQKRVRIYSQPYRADNAPAVFTIPGVLEMGTGKGTKERFEVRADNNASYCQFLHEIYVGPGIKSFDYRAIHVVKKAS